MSGGYRARGVLFDIDGTLVRVGGAGRQALVEAAAQVCGIPTSAVQDVVDAMDFRGCTDALLLEELASRLGRPLQEVRGPLIACYLEALEGAMQRSHAVLLPGVAPLIETLEARGVQVGLLTGNMREGARRKLRPVGLHHLVERPGGFGDDGRERAAIARHAVAQLVAAGVRPGAVVVIGDTEHDISAARAAGAAAVAVATGWTATEVLTAARPDVHVSDLTDATPVLTLLDRL